jgi:hypothetical protein
LKEEEFRMTEKSERSDSQNHFEMNDIFNNEE